MMMMIDWKTASTLRTFGRPTLRRSRANQILYYLYLYGGETETESSSSLIVLKRKGKGPFSNFTNTTQLNTHPPGCSSFNPLSSLPFFI